MVCSNSSYWRFGFSIRKDTPIQCRKARFRALTDLAILGFGKFNSLQTFDLAIFFGRLLGGVPAHSRSLVASTFYVNRQTASNPSLFSAGPVYRLYPRPPCLAAQCRPTSFPVAVGRQRRFRHRGCGVPASALTRSYRSYFRRMRRVLSPEIPVFRYIYPQNFVI